MPTKEQLKNANCIGLIVKQNCGMNATCIAYRKANDIEVQFEDGLIKTTRKSQFVSGQVQNPNIPKDSSKIIRQSSCLNEKRKMNNGQYAVCIAYRKADDIDIQFEDGYIVEHARKKAFYDGKIANMNLGKNAARRRSILGEKKLMNNGQYATCIAYRGARDIDVEFEDGTIVKNRQKVRFIEGTISNPNWKIKSLPQQIIYEAIVRFFPNATINYRPDFMKNPNTGKNLEIDIWIPELKVGIEYDGYPWHKKDNKSTLMKQQLFRESTEVVQIHTFVEKGCVIHEYDKNTNYFLDSTSSSNKVIRLYSCLEECINKLLSNLGVNEPSIILDNSFLNSVREKMGGNIYLGLTMKMNNGMNATIIGFRNVDDIDIQFEDGTIARHKTKGNFIRGVIANVNLGVGAANIKNYVGLQKKMNNGMNATIIRSNGANDIDVEFEDGTIIYNTTKERFDSCSIANPTIGINYTSHKKFQIIGVRKKMKNGQFAIVIADRSAMDIDVQFEDGYIAKNVPRANFNRGVIHHPKYDKYELLKEKSSCLGQTIMQKNGMNATCIAYRQACDIDLQFEDGAIAYKKTKTLFLNGQIAHPLKSRQLTKIKNSSCAGITRVMNNGMSATCIAYRGCSDIDIEFEDGTIVCHKQKSKFLNGTIGHPNKKR